MMPGPAHWIGAALVCVLLGACAARNSLPAEQPSAATRDAQRAAEQRARWVRAARAICLQRFGPDFVMLETAEGHLVCRPAPRKGTV